jgi:iron complex outermembrane receptor protein
VRYSQTDIAFSPSLIVAGSFNFNLKINPSFRPMFLVVYKKNFVTDLEFSLIPKYVGKQFIDNTSNVERQLDGYFTTDARISFIRKAEKSGRFISFNFLLRNMLNKLYVNNAWAYTYSLGGQQFSDIGYYPQAGINYFMGLTFGF